MVKNINTKIEGTIYVKTFTDKHRKRKLELVGEKT